MRIRISALVALVASAAALGAGSATAETADNSAPCGPAAKACLDLSQQRAWLMNGGKVVYGPVPVASGRPGYATPPGIYHVTFKNAHFWSTAFNAPMPYSVFFNGGMAFHEGSVHVPSHGCVHLTQAAAVEFFNYLDPGDEVQVVP
jgi:lipoprotein-anchoring transpeptidase ErfK/SrfK